MSKLSTGDVICGPGELLIIPPCHEIHIVTCLYSKFVLQMVYVLITCVLTYRIGHYVPHVHENCVPPIVTGSVRLKISTSAHMPRIV